MSVRMKSETNNEICFGNSEKESLMLHYFTLQILLFHISYILVNTILPNITM